MNAIVRHKFSSPVPDGPDAARVRPSNWDDDHDVDLGPVGNALIALGGAAAGDVAYMTADSGAALFNTSAFARTLLALIDAAAMLALLQGAPLASPALTGTPTAPTAAAGTNTTQIASTAFVRAAIDALIAASPGALDTLNELAAALGNDPNFATTITNLLALKAPLASPALTGAPTAPTVAGTADSTAKIATTAFVQAVAALKAAVVHTHAQSDVTNLVTDLAAKAPLASPALTGTPTAPSAAVDTNTTQVATTAFVVGQASAAGDGTPAMDGTAARGSSLHFARADHVHPTDTSRAPLASPALTGTPTAPTAAPGTNTTQLATAAFVQAAIAALIAAAPGALDTLDELAAAMGDDANFVTTVTNALALKAALASPAFTGTPTAPTVAGTADSTTKIATTAFIQAVAALKANLDSPALTGTPTAPTVAGTADSTTKIATTAFVQACLTAIGAAVVATQAEQETATATNRYVTSGRQQYHPSAAKAWLWANAQSGTPTVLASYNVASITDNGVGDYTVNLTTAFSSANYGVSGIGDRTTGAGCIGYRSIVAGAFGIYQFNPTNYALTDGIFGLSAFGDQ